MQYSTTELQNLGLNSYSIVRLLSVRRCNICCNTSIISLQLNTQSSPFVAHSTEVTPSTNDDKDYSIAVVIQSIIKLVPPDFAWKYIQIISNLYMMMMMMMMTMMIKMIISANQLILKLGPPNFAWKQIQIISNRK